MKNIVNLTPHPITVGDATFPPSGTIARVKAGFSAIDDGVCHQTFGSVIDLPDPQEGVRLVVSGLVFAATGRLDVFAPATGHPDVVRNDQGHIVSVPALIGKEGA
jgi:hypothetical protein|tara:strand:- start:791 stop:1105 length:315 start_codon:yes stop_codon:yes gene_type:complete